MTPSIGINYSGKSPRGHLRTDALVGAGYRDWCGTLKELLSNKSSHKCFRLRPEPSQQIPVYSPSYFLLLQKTTSYWCKRQRARAADRFMRAKRGSVLVRTPVRLKVLTSLTTPLRACFHWVAVCCVKELTLSFTILGKPHYYYILYPLW